MIKRLDEYIEKKDFALEKDDELWVMIDVDRWNKSTLQEIAKEARQKGYRLAISNPCFELWLLLHFRDFS